MPDRRAVLGDVRVDRPVRLPTRHVLGQTARVGAAPDVIAQEAPPR